MKTQSRVQKLITFPPHLYSLLEKKADQLGVSFATYIRTLAIYDIKNQIEEIPLVDEETEKQIGQALNDLKEGRFTTIKNGKELDEYLKSL